MNLLLLSLVIGFLTVIPIPITTTMIVYASTIEVPTYNPPYTHHSEGAAINGSKIVDYFGIAEVSQVDVQYYNKTVPLDVSSYEDCMNKDITNDPLMPNKTKYAEMDFCITSQDISHALDIFGDTMEGLLN